MLRFLPFLLCLATALTVAAALWPVLGGEYTYEQFVVGSMSWHAENKSVDYQALAVVVTVFLALALALGRFVDRIDDAASDVRAGVENVMAFALLPLALWLGTAMTRNATPGFPYAFVLSGSAFALYAAWLWNRSPKLDGKTISDLGGALLCTFLLAFFAGLACLLLIFHASGHGVPASPEIVLGAALAAVGINALVVGTVLASPGEQAIAERSLQRWIVFLQFPLPLLGLVLLPAFITYRGVAEPYVWPWSLVLALAVYAACAWFRLSRRLRADGTAGSLDRALEPLALAMIAVFLVSPHAMFELMSAPGYPTLFGDDFHLGEQILPWQQWHEFHRLPYVDFAPVHGLMPLLTGALNEVFFDGTLAHLDLAFALLVAISCVMTVCLASRTCGALVGLALCFLLAPFDRLLFLAPALLLVSDAALLRRPVAWLATWVAVVVFMIGYNAAVGSAFAGGTMPWALMALYRSWRSGKSAREGVVLVALVAVAALLLIPHLAEVFMGLLAFIAENGATNMVGHGVALARGFGLPGTPTDGVLASRILFDLLCLAWIVVALHALQRGIADWLAARRGHVAASVAVLPLATSLTLLLLAAWSIGRIDVEFSSRTGAVSFLAVGTLLPVVILARGRHPASVAILAFALIVGLFAGMHGLGERFSPQQLLARAVPRVEVPLALVRTSGADFGGKRVGTLFIPPDRYEEITAFRNALANVLLPGQTYLDLTNRQAMYFYLDRPVPALYAATFNALNKKQQQGMLDQLAANPPAAVFIAPALEADAIKASLRSFFLYRYVLRGYRPVVVGPYTFLVKTNSETFRSDPDPLRDEAVLDAIFAHPNLQMLPATWGHSWSSLKAEAQPLGEFMPTLMSTKEHGCRAVSADSSTSVALGRYEFGAARDASGRVDLIEIRLREVANPPATLTLRYASLPAGATHSITMQVSGTTLIVPVASYPSWLLSKAVPSIELCAPAGNVPPGNLIAGVTAWTIPDPSH